MNISLIDALVQAVLALSIEERVLFQQNLQQHQDNWQETTQRLKAFQAKLKAQRSGSLPNIPVEDIIHQMRDDRTEQLMQTCFPESENS